MPQFTAVAFKWTGTYYNAQYNTSHTAEFTDNDGAFQGRADSDETISIDGGAAMSTTHLPYSIDVSFTDTSGNAHVENFNFFQTGGEWYFVPGPNSEFTVGATLGSYKSHTVGWDYKEIICLTRGTLVETKNGPVAIEKLHPGMRVVTVDGGAADLRLSLSRKITGAALRCNPKLHPVRIMAGALGEGLPRRDLLVSRHHRMLVNSAIAERMFGQREVLVAAIRLTELPGIFVDDNIDEVEYFHLVFDRHEIIIAEGAATESLHAGTEALKALTPQARTELLEVFPEFPCPGSTPDPACMIPHARQQKLLISRHLKNLKPLVTGL